MSSEITNFEQFRCPICFFILIEPVSLPCNHKLCLACFDKQVEEVNYTCPICRHRISNWARNVSRENSLVDEELWKQIQAQFPAVVSDHIRSKISLGLLSAKCICLTSPCSCTSHAKHAVETPGLICFLSIDKIEQNLFEILRFQKRKQLHIILHFLEKYPWNISRSCKGYVWGWLVRNKQT